MYKNLYAVTRDALFSLKGHIDIQDLAKQLEDFVAIDKYAGGNIKQQKDALEQAKKENGALKQFARKIAVDVDKRKKYRACLEKLNDHHYWDELTASHNKIDAEKQAALEALKQHFTGIQAMAIYRLPLALILHKLDVLQKMKAEIATWKNTATNKAENDELQSHHATIYNKLMRLDDSVNDLIKLHIHILVKKMEVIKNNPKLVDDPLPYAISILESAGVSHHQLPRYSWAPEKTVTSTLAQLTLNAISHYGNGDAMLALGKFSSQEEGSIKLFTLVEKLHTNVRYNTVCPIELAPYLQLRPPLFPRLQRGLQKRFEFFNEAWIPLHTMNCLAHETQRLLTLPLLSAPQCEKLKDNLVTLEHLMRTHEALFQKVSLPTTWWARWFWPENIAFQSTWSSALIGVKRKIIDIQLNAADKLLQDAHVIQKTHYETGLAQEPLRCVQLKSSLEIILDPRGLAWMSHDASSQKQKALHDELCKHKNYLMKASCFSHSDAPRPLADEKETLSFRGEVIDALKAGDIDTALNAFHFVMYSSSRALNKYKPSLDCLASIHSTLKEMMEVEVIKHMTDPARRSKYKQLLTAFRHVVLGEYADNKTDLDGMYQAYEKRLLPLTDILNDISSEVLAYVTKKTWRWPLDVEKTGALIEKNKEELKKDLGLYRQHSGHYLRKAIDKAQKAAWDAGDFVVCQQIGAILQFLQANFMGCKQQYDESNKIKPPRKNVQPIPVLTSDDNTHCTLREI